MVLDLCIFLSTFSLEKAILWIEDSYFSQSDGLKVKKTSWWIIQTWSFLLHKTVIDGLESCGLLVDYCDVIISCLNSYSDGTHSLQRIHWWASDVMLNCFKSVLMKKQTHLHLGCSKFSAIFHFWVHYSFNRTSKPKENHRSTFAGNTKVKL